MQWVKRGVVIALVWSGSVWADPAQELVNLLNSEQQAEQLQAQMIPLIIRGAGEHAQELAQHCDVLEAWVSRYLSWGAMSTEVAAIYRKHFTEAELKQLIAFYQSPVGKKSLDTMPAIFQESSLVGQSLAERNMPALQAMLDEAKRKATK
ncbi:DUF2059 domain-containing protein [Aeromonas hydrophila]|uniref:DUF2059 domain-containing protein n=1 Tax=Aeromonas hydrophila subsp. hydrophila (strain ATCC 7966 / DSM 30187 / BCRC 13018 / CCUG 14551 / JCM 1027 / KCTC 2358 / NCIMB 9240 / NCTC 8049) TaxID=380703 RepID=A0KM07_AERHH|nr:DUF2059 domain-containing protein [Aeromonas hydrophila]ABK38947.1 conserved hypothetical protein [Aeromonas hydrophila subsp. hydrophila ATCC 7966]MBS4672277.1 DUF2059 domain-containing protein [Aeromonas hydrophila]OOD36113.1 hypothetical protein BWP11_01250 [Aeromonas hydrophila]SUU29820.1 Uncharacterized protein conserved in bacteria [Aeromonas hydrophila]